MDKIEETFFLKKYHKQYYLGKRVKCRDSSTDFNASKACIKYLLEELFFVAEAKPVKQPNASVHS